MSTRIVVADDHPVVLDGIRLMLESLREYTLVGVATSLREIVSVCAETHPDILVLDLNLEGQNGLDLVPELRQRHPALQILIFSAYQSSSLTKKALEAGVDGYLLKDASKAEWAEALSHITQGKMYLSKHLKAGEGLRFDTQPVSTAFPQLAALSEQERKIIRLTAQGLTEQAIAESLFISKHTVHTHKKNIFRKFRLHTNTDLVKFAYENSLV
ncbi:two component system response regulator [Nibrella viscosa]|uniref:Two component system response regulator n=1 Tax=Nibrella viscosa TaxID=1084524 RepID=A0ABP8K7D3_9BACT